MSNVSYWKYFLYKFNQQIQFIHQYWHFIGNVSNFTPRFYQCFVVSSNIYLQNISVHYWWNILLKICAIICQMLPNIVPMFVFYKNFLQLIRKYFILICLNSKKLFIKIKKKERRKGKMFYRRTFLFRIFC